MGAKGRVSTSGGDDLAQNPFGALRGLADLPAGPGNTSVTVPPDSKRGQLNLKRGRVEIRRLTGGRGGKTVTAVSGFKGIATEELARLAKQMQKSCGVGGTVKGGQIEIQGDKREQVAAILAKAGFQPVMAGG